MDRDLKQWKKEMEHIQPPQPELDQAIAVAIHKGRRKKRNKWKKAASFSGIAVCLIGLLYLGTLVSPTMAKTLQSLPLIGSVFEFTGDDGLRDASEKGLLEEVDQSVTDNGVTLSITDVLYDGTRLSVGYVHQSEQKIEGIDHFFSPESMHILIDGERLHNFGTGATGKQISAHEYAGVINIKTDEELPEKFTLGLEINQIGSQKGQWHFEIPLTELEHDSFLVAQEPKSYADQTITVQKVVSTPSTTEVRFKLVEPFLEDPEDVLENTLEYRLFDDQGMMLQPLGWGSSGTLEKDEEDGENEDYMIREMKAQFGPLQELPEYVVFQAVKPSSSAEVPRKVKARATGEFPIKLDQGEIGQLFITDIDFHEDHTVVHYEAEGREPYFQKPLQIIDAEGGEYDYEGAPQRVSDTEYQFTLKFPPVDPKQTLFIQTVEIDAPEVIEELEFKIPLE